jgi:hypothetical protein
VSALKSSDNTQNITFELKILTNNNKYRSLTKLLKNYKNLVISLFIFFISFSHSFTISITLFLIFSFFLSPNSHHNAVHPTVTVLQAHVVTFLFVEFHTIESLSLSGMADNGGVW